MANTNSFSNFLALESVLSQADQSEMRLTNNSNGQPLYSGKCLTPNGATSSAIWFIKKYSYDDNGFLSRVQLPDNGAGFLYIWDNASSYFS